MSDYQKNIQRSQALGISSYQGLPQEASIDPYKRAANFLAQSEAAHEEVQPRSGANPTQGMKHDTGKEPLSLLSRVWLLGVARVMGFGAIKYAAHNWRSGLERSRLISAAMRHIIAYNEGEDQDPETGLSHLDHASCCLMFAREMHETHPHLDDRYKQGEKK